MVQQKWESPGMVVAAQQMLYVLLNVWLLDWTIFKQNSKPTTAVTAEEVSSLLQFFYFSFILFCFLEDLVIFLSFFFKRTPGCFVLPGGKSWTFDWVTWETNCCFVPSHPWSHCWGSRHSGKIRDGMGCPVGPRGINRARAKGRDVQKCIRAESLEVGSFTTWKLRISPACHRNIPSNMMRLSKTCPVIFWWW